MGLSKDELARLAASRKTCAWFRLRRVSRAITNLYDTALKPSGVRATQFAVLTALSQFDEPIAMQKLACLLAVDRTTLTRLLSPLSDRGLLTVASGEDQRVRLVSLTPAGATVLARALPLWEHAQATLEKALGDESMRAMVASLIAAEKSLDSADLSSDESAN